MAATYPPVKKIFSPHANFTEDVDASHINALQDEVAAIENVLEVYPTKGVINNGVVFDFGTVRARIENASRGFMTPALAVSRATPTATQAIASGINNVTLTWPTVVDPLAVAAAIGPTNSLGVMGGAGLSMAPAGDGTITIPRSGIYVISGNIEFGANSAAGWRQFSIVLSGIYVSVVHCPAVGGAFAGTSTRLSTSWLGKLNSGSTVQFRAAQDSGGSIGVYANAGLAWMRDA